MNRVLFVIHTSTYFSNLFELGFRIKRAGILQPLFLFINQYPTIFNDMERLKKNSIEFFMAEEGKLIFPSLNNSKRTLSKWLVLTRILLSVFWRVTLFCLYLARTRPFRFIRRIFVIELCLKIFELRVRQAQIFKILKFYEIDLILLGGDLPQYDSAIFVKVAKTIQVSSAIIPSWMASAREAAESFMYQKQYQAKLLRNRIAAKLYPKWYYQHKGVPLVRLPAAEILAREWLKIAPQKPWVLNSSNVDIIAVESLAMYKYGVNEGLPSSQLLVTGSLAHDQMHQIITEKEKIKKDFFEKLHLPADQSLLLCALPPDFLYRKGGRPECEFTNYRDLIDFWINSLKNIEGFNSVICVHPSTTSEQIKFIENFKMPIARDPTSMIIPLCEIYLASVSATIQWAIACGIPVINYDVYQYDYTDYLEVEGVILVRNRLDYLNALKKITSDSEYYEKIKRNQKLHSQEWGEIDGNAYERISVMLNRLIRKKS